VLYAVTDDVKRYHGGITAFLVEREKHGYTVGQKFEKMGLTTAPLSELVFDDVRLGPDAVLGVVGAGSQMFNESMEWERICIPASHVGAMERLLETAIRYTRTRKASGQSISKFQAVSHRIVDMKVRHETARLLVYKAASRLGVSRTVGMDASMAKLYVSESLVTNALDTIRVLGGYGYMREYEVERALRDGVGSLIYSGTSEIQKNSVAGWLGL
jgi:alkylation response protein AidB-like acyl-CoA dehydrogenase